MRGDALKNDDIKDQDIRRLKKIAYITQTHETGGISPYVLEEDADTPQSLLRALLEISHKEGRVPEGGKRAKVVLYCYLGEVIGTRPWTIDLSCQ